MLFKILYAVLAISITYILFYSIIVIYKVHAHKVIYKNRVDEDVKRKLLKSVRYFQSELDVYIDSSTFIVVEIKEFPKKHFETQGYITRNKDIYYIRINNNQSYYSMINVLAHEMVHLKQYVKGELETDGKGKYKWKNVDYTSKTKYMERPWEQEAFDMQKDLTKGYFFENKMYLAYIYLKIKSFIFY